MEEPAVTPTIQGLLATADQVFQDTVVKSTKADASFHAFTGIV